MVPCLCLELIFIHYVWNITKTFMKRNLDLKDHTRSLDGYLELDWETFERLKRLWDYKLEDVIFNLFVVPTLFPCNRAKKRR